MVDSLTNELTQNSNAMSRGMLESDIDLANQFFMETYGMNDVAQFMKNIAATESNLGQDSLRGQAFSPFQIDAIKYVDIIRGNPSRLGKINQFLGEQLGDKNFDLSTYLPVRAEVSPNRQDTTWFYEPSANLMEHNPLVGAVLTRAGLSRFKESIPKDLPGQAKYWKDYWNTHHPGAKGTEEKFISQVKHHYPNLKDYSGE